MQCTSDSTRHLQVLPEPAACAEPPPTPVTDVLALLAPNNEPLAGCCGTVGTGNPKELFSDVVGAPDVV